MNTIQNKYYFQALDNFPYNMEDTMEALNYALSYDPNQADCLCLLARVYAEVLNDYTTAKEYFERAMASNLHCISLYPPYIECLLWNEDFQEAEKLIHFALTVKGVDKAAIYNKKSLWYEYQRDYKNALKAIDEARLHTYTQSFMSHLDDRAKLIKQKEKKVNKKPRNSK